ncbi:MAG TPA: YihY/virulence factor BrkB family protein [Bryobacteraceae bacterium]
MEVNFAWTLRRTARESWKDEVFGQAARLAFYHFLGLFPFLLLAVLVLMRFEHSGARLLETLDSSLRRVFPVSAASVVTGFLAQVSSRANREEIGVAALGSMWAAFNGTWAVMAGLNSAYEVEDRRSWWKITLIAGGLTVALGLLGFIALGLLLFGARIGLMTEFGAAWRILHWAVIAVLLLVAFALLYRFGPDLEDMRFRWGTPGAAIAVFLWISTSLVFRAYAERAASKYDLAYGSLASAALLMLWFYVTGVAILIGGEVNSEIENAAAQNGHPDARRPGERRPGGRPAPRVEPPDH